MVKKVKVLVTGRSGQLGSAIEKLSLSSNQFEWIFFDSDKLDFTNTDQIKETIIAINPDILINCAAYTAVDKAESEVDKCYKINATAVAILAETCKEINCKLIHISTDYVYHLNKSIPLEESDPTHPRGVYARSKRQGEMAIMHSLCPFIIIRTSWVYHYSGANFVKTILRLSHDKKELSVVNDQFGALTYANDLAKAILHIISKYKDNTRSWNQIYNFSNQGITNWAEIAESVVALKTLDLKIQPIPTSAYPTPASRPNWSVLSSEKFIKTFDYTIPEWKESLEECLKEL